MINTKSGRKVEIKTKRKHREQILKGANSKM